MRLTFVEWFGTDCPDSVSAPALLLSDSDFSEMQSLDGRGILGREVRRRLLSYI